MKNLALIAVLVPVLAACSGFQQAAPIWYEYAASTVLEDGVYHTFFCSAPSNNDMDFARHRTSTTGSGTPYTGDVVISPLDGEQSACDPDVIKFNGEYHLFYSAIKQAPLNTPLGIQTVVWVSTGPTITGPFTNRHLIQDSPYGDGPGVFTGMPSVVVLNGKIYMWTFVVPEEQTDEIWLSVSDDPNNFPPPVKTNLVASSPAVVYDEDQGLFVITTLRSYNQNGGDIYQYTSADGITWISKGIIGRAPPWANDSGVSKDNQGHWNSSVSKFFMAGVTVVPVSTLDMVTKVDRILWNFNLN